MESIIVSLIWAAVAALFVARADRAFHAWLDRTEGKPSDEPEGQTPLPPDLYAVAMQESETWAQEERIKVMQEKYVTLGRDWNRVRAAVGVGQMEGST